MRSVIYIYIYIYLTIRRRKECYMTFIFNDDFQRLGVVGKKKCAGKSM